MEAIPSRQEILLGFPNYNLLLCVSSHVDPPKSGEDPCRTHEIMDDLGVSTLSLPRFGFSYSLWSVKLATLFLTLVDW